MIKNFQSILCLNGTIPHKDLFDRFSKLPLVAADGAGYSLIQMGLLPTLIVGDMDSFPEKAELQNIEVIYNSDQNSTDFEKCISEMKKRSLFPALVCGVSGKEIDYSLHNIHCLMKYGKQNPMVFYDEGITSKPKLCIPIYDFYKFKGRENSVISLLPYPSARLSTKGLKWELKRNELSIFGSSSVRNQINNEDVEITIHQGQVLLILDEL